MKSLAKAKTFAFLNNNININKSSSLNKKNDIC
jgi:hypothetical protein